MAYLDTHSYTLKSYLLMRKRLNAKEAQFLGLVVKPKEGIRNPRYSISETQLQELVKFRNIDAISEHAEQIGIDEDDVKHGWFKTDDVSFFFTNPNYKSKQKEDFKERLLDYISQKSPKYPKLNRKELTDSHLLVINPADIHLGKLASSFETGDEYTVGKAIERVHEGVSGILEKSKGFKIDKILFVGGNDVLHIDTPRATTTSGTFQNTDGMWYDNYLKAFQLYVEILEKLIVEADVHFVYCPSNHDYTNGFFLCQAVEQYFRNNKNITFDNSISHRKYYTYGLNLIGLTHGDGGKMQDLPLTMAHEAKDWSSCKHRYLYIHHFHHKIGKDFQGVALESMRSPSGTDSWHHRNQYCNNIKAVEGFIHHKEYGQICRLNHIF